MSGNNVDRLGRVNVPQALSAGDGQSRRAGIRAAMTQVKNGQTIPAEDVEAWVESWNTPDELAIPEPRRR